MPHACKVCTHPSLAAITKAIGAGGSDQSVASRFGLSKSGVHRHRNNCMGMARKTATSGAAAEGVRSAGPLRFANGEVKSAGDLLERLHALFRLGDLLEEAYERRDIDACVKLAREYRAAAESYAKIAGWMSDGANVTIDARRQEIAVYDAIPLAKIDAYLEAKNVNENRHSRVLPAAVDAEELAP